MDGEKLEWLMLPPNTWSLMSQFKRFSEFVLNLPVVNDAAERNVKLLQDFINMSHDEGLRQDLLLAVELKRKSSSVKQPKKLKKVN
jgi:hypothetical protein